MKVFRGLSLNALSLSVMLTQVLGFTPPPVFENTEISRSIDVTGSYVRETLALTIKNVGDSPESTYYFAVDAETFAKIAVFEGREKRARKKGFRILNMYPSKEFDEEENVNFYEIELHSPLDPNEETDIQLGIAVVNKIFASPQYAAQSESQLLAVRDNRFTLSAYPTISQTLKVNTVGLQVSDISAKELQSDENDRAEAAGESPFDLSPTSDGIILQYGPYENVQAYTSSPLVIRYEYPRAVTKTVDLQRDIWVSHWGASVSFEEVYQLHHFGTQLENNYFSRLDYVRRGKGYTLNTAALQGLEIALPEHARDIYFTDLVGNVSTSVVRPSSDDSVALILKPRYPVFGGWNYNFTIGWSVGLDEYLAQPDPVAEPDTFILRVPLIQGPTEMPYDQVTINLVFPEGATDIDLAALHPSQPQSLSLTKSYLDFSGRPTLQLVYHNVIDNYQKSHVYVTYKYTKQSAFVKPLMVSAIFGTFFTVALIVGKIDVSVSSFKPKTKKAE